MSADIERHDFVPSPRADRCAECYCPAGHAIHGGRRPATCRMTGPHNGHAGCAGIDFPPRVVGPLREEDARDADLLTRTVTVGELIAIASVLIRAIPDDLIGDAEHVGYANGISTVIREAAGVRPQHAYVIDDLVACYDL